MVDPAEGSPSRLDGDKRWWRASFSIFSVTLTPRQISERIGLKPTSTHERGQPKGARRLDGSIVQSIVWKDSAWLLNSPLKTDRNLTEHIKWLLDAIEPKADEIKALSAECKLIRFFCGFSSGNGQGGFGLDPELLGRISRLGVELVLDLYPPSGPDILYRDSNEQTTPTIQ